MARSSYRFANGLVNLAGTLASLFVNAPLFSDANTSDVAVPWTAVPTLQSSWANVASHQAAQYRVDALGVVHLRGVIDTGTKAATTLITTLPAGARPPAATILPIVSDVAAGVASTLKVATTGAITVGTVALTTACQISLEGLSFDTNE